MSIDPLLENGPVNVSPPDRRTALAIGTVGSPRAARADRLRRHDREPASDRDSTSGRRVTEPSDIERKPAYGASSSSRRAGADRDQGSVRPRSKAATGEHTGWSNTNDPLLTTGTLAGREATAGPDVQPSRPKASAEPTAATERARRTKRTKSTDRTTPAATARRTASSARSAGADLIGRSWRRAATRLDRAVRTRTDKQSPTLDAGSSGEPTQPDSTLKPTVKATGESTGDRTAGRRRDTGDPTVTDRPRRQLRGRRHDGDEGAIEQGQNELNAMATSRRWRTHNKSPYRDIKFVDDRPKVKALGPAPVTYYALVVLISMFVMLGLVMVLSATSVNRIGGPTSPYTIFIRQSAWAVVGLIAMVVVLKVPYQRWRLFVIPAFLAALGLMCVPFVPGLGLSINDARSWIRVGSFTMQPSEFLKLASICLLADYFTRVGHRVQRHRWGLFPFGLVTFGAAGLAFIQGDLGSAIVLAAATIAVAVIAGLPMRDIGLVVIAGIAGAAAAIITSPRRFHRFTAFLDPQGNKDDLAFQSWQGLLSIANGGLTGSGIGGSRSKMGYLPLAHSDFIFAVIADELGFIGTIAVVGGFIVLVWLGLQVARAAPDQFGTTLAAGITAWFGVQAIVNMGGVVGLMPVTGLTLPFFSAGGTSLLVSMIAAALLMNIARRGVTEGAVSSSDADQSDLRNNSGPRRRSPKKAAKSAAKKSAAKSGPPTSSSGPANQPAAADPNRERTSLTVVR